MADRSPDTPDQEWCNCQALPDTDAYPGPWHPQGDDTCKWWQPPTAAPDTHITADMIAKGADGIRDLLTILGVDPDELIEHNDAPTVAAQLAESVLQAGLAGCTVVELPEPKAWRNRLTGDMHIWPIGGWAATAEPGKVSISQSPDGLGGGLGFTPDTAREFGRAFLAAAALAEHLAGSVSPKGDNTNG